MHKINFKSKNNSYGFTLIELLVVISIIAMLSSVMYAFMDTSRARAMDTKKKIEVREVGTALRLYYENNGTMPRNFKGNLIAEEGDGFYEQSMQELVDKKVLSAIPKSIDGSHYYYYYDDTKPDGEGATFFTYLKMDGYPVYMGNEGVVKKLNVQEGCNSSQVWNGSACVTETPNLSLVPPPSPPNVIVDDINNTVQGMKDGMEYSLDGVAYVPYNANTFYTIDFRGDHTLLIRYSSSGNIPASYITTLIFTVDINPVVNAFSLNTVAGSPNSVPRMTPISSAPPGTRVLIFGTGFSTVSNIIRIANESGSPIGFLYTGGISGLSWICSCVFFPIPNFPPGTYRITIDNSQYGIGTVYKTFTITTPGSDPSISILNPNGGEILTLGNQYTINWTADNLSTVYPGYPIFRISLLNENGNVSLGYIAYNLSSSARSFIWTVGNVYSDIALTQPVTISAGKYRIIVKDGLGHNPISASYFNIVSP
ncbi:MAG: type II secretion system protein [Patescibacteria group bacterium]